MTKDIPIIDFHLYKQDLKEFSENIKKAIENIGFFYLKNHGITLQEISEMFENSEKFFKLPSEVKSLYNQKNNFGYSSFKHEILDPNKQTLNDGILTQELPNIFMENLEKIYKFEKKCHNLCMNILEGLAISLEIPESEGGRFWFKSRHRYEKKSGSVLRALHYPPSTFFTENIKEKDTRAGSHSDYGSLTLLFQKDVGGLEIYLSDSNDNSGDGDNGEEESKWISAPIIPGCIIINIGDLMNFWTKGLLKSTKHRVVFKNNTMNTDRYSIAYFLHPEDDTHLDPIPSRFIDNSTISNTDNVEGGKSERVGNDSSKKMTAGDYLKYKLDMTHFTY
ncbi:1152_t:CDS:2 [Entrophospora sp. SA101]|nr:4000_t:CDS:2 [Entrophospora sp. SA101]CAJ0759363.1 17154_t:CDS:2 [Entrophospora sp. SA101]CAJ0766056.1 1152_t:CDS:2 [Entrophospora sp. SA101]CAJ0840415.1 14423_t:CDS:2 [Entrophospora sp. SA101]CAJ0876216.1 14825_t:CDS:2 [Entrophospora sp. SA101]